MGAGGPEGYMVEKLISVDLTNTHLREREAGL